MAIKDLALAGKPSSRPSLLVNIEGNQTCSYSPLFTTNAVATVCLFSAEICKVEHENTSFTYSLVPTGTVIRQLLPYLYAHDPPLPTHQTRYFECRYQLVLPSHISFALIPRTHKVCHAAGVSLKYLRVCKEDCSVAQSMERMAVGGVSVPPIREFRIPALGTLHGPVIAPWQCRL